jgi:hypothetical protein
MSPADLATLSLLDAEQGVCPNGHACRLSEHVGERACDHGEYRGLALTCWDITRDEIDRAEAAGAAIRVVDWARLTMNERG